ncbi:growth hormone receptor binding protein [Rhizobium sp. BK376]|nr:growth hormone receptor binding protein [Rhizobium sp. BK376]
MWKLTSSMTAIVHRERRVSSGSVLLHAFFITSVLAGAAIAQQPTEEQRSAIRSACRSDFIAQCSSVKPGGIEALNCLKEHDASLSPACKQAISAIGAKKSSSAAPTTTQPATAATSAPAAGAMSAQAPTQAQKSAIKSNCRNDFMAQCSGVTPGGQEALSCLQAHSTSLSPACKQSVAALGGAGTAAGGGAVATAPAQAAPPAMHNFSPREELIVMRRSCGPDFRALCRAVPLGGGRGIACLKENFARVSPGCQKILTSGL